MTSGFDNTSIHSWDRARRYFFNLFAIFWQGQTYRRLCYLFMAVPLGILYSLVLIIGLLFPLILIYLAVIRRGLPSPLFISTVLIGILVWRLIPRFVKTAIRAERFLARKFIGQKHLGTATMKTERVENCPDPTLQTGLLALLKEVFYITFRIPMGLANLILIVISILLLVLMILAPWIYEMSGPSVIFSSVTIDTFPKAILLMILAVPMFIIVMRSLRTLALIQGRFAIFMLAKEST